MRHPVHLCGISLDFVDSVDDGDQVVLTIWTQESLIITGHEQREVAGEGLPEPDGARSVRV